MASAHHVALAASLLIAAAGMARGQSIDLTHLSIEDLMNMNVSLTSAGKKPQALNDVAAAAFVLTADDIRRSGAQSIPDALRMVPGLQVAEVNANSWAISSRGFNSTFGNKLLVLVDGRSVYSPLFSGVLWSLQDILMADIERIEVIRGPGATLWGANAVNGVINIITKPASETQGGLAQLGGGSKIGGFAALRYGGAFSDDGHYRVSLKLDQIMPGIGPNGSHVTDRFVSGTASFRADWKGSPLDTYTVQGGVTKNRTGETFVQPQLSPPYSRVVSAYDFNSDLNLLGRWTHRFSETSELSVQAYIGTQIYRQIGVDSQVNTQDIEIQHRFSPAQGHDVIWGAGFRHVNSETSATANVALVPERGDQTLYQAFIQDDITLVAQRLHLILGTKLEYNSFTGFEPQPSVRLLWTPDETQSLWAAVSRAVRTPSIGERTTRTVQAVMPTAFGLPLAVTALGSTHLASEKLIAIEAGYRIRPLPNLSFDVSTFYNIYDQLRLATIGAPFPVFQPSPYLVLPVTTANLERATGYGLEVAAEWRPLPSWRLRAAYSYLQLQSRPIVRPGVTTSSNNDVQSPKHSASLQSSVDLGHNIEFDVIARHVGQLSTLGVKNYTTADMRVSWRGIPGVELSLIGQNLIGPSRIEFVPDLVPWVPSRVGPSVFALATLRF